MSIQAQRGGGVIHPTHSQPGTRRKWLVSTILQQLNHQTKPITIVEKAGWASALVKMGQKISSHGDLLCIGWLSNTQQITIHFPTGHVCEYISYTVLMIIVPLL